MSRSRFEGILEYPCYTDQNIIEYYNGFFHMRKIEEARKLNMAEEFNP